MGWGFWGVEDFCIEEGASLFNSFLTVLFMWSFLDHCASSDLRQRASSFPFCPVDLSIRADPVFIFLSCSKGLFIFCLLLRIPSCRKCICFKLTLEVTQRREIMPAYVSSIAILLILDRCLSIVSGRFQVGMSACKHKASTVPTWREESSCLTTSLACLLPDMICPPCYAFDNIGMSRYWGRGAGMHPVTEFCSLLCA